MAACLLVFSGTAARSAIAESYSATGMRLLKYEGSVEIEDASGQPRFVLENVRFDSGEALKTGKDSSASVGLDDDRIVTLDEESRVEFTLKDKHMEMLLTEGGLLLDVQDKLGDDETLDIKTSTIAVGIRGTIVYLREVEAKTDKSSFESVGLGAGQEAASGRTTVLGILEGTAELSYQDEQGTTHTLPVSAGQKATLKDSNTNAFADSPPAITELTQDDIRGFIEEQIQSNPAMKHRVDDAKSISESTDYPADGDWTWDRAVTLVAQSASKLYDGSPLTRPGDVLVYGLPEGLSIRVSAGGSQTDAGTGANPVSNYAIFNAAGEEVTSHFSNIQTVPGMLTVDPAPLTAWTASASKTYDGTPLTDKEAEIHFYPVQESGEAPWRNSSFVVRGGGTAVSGATGTSASGTTASGTAGGVAAGIAGGAVSDSAGGDAAGKSGTSTTPAPADAATGIAPGTEKADTEVLYGICGTIWVHGTNPLTKETRETQLYAGEKMTVYLSSGGANGQTIEFKVEKISESELPEEILRLYADNPGLLKQACADTGWNEQLLEQLIAGLPAVSESSAAVVEQNGLQVNETAAEDLMRDCTNVRITIDTQITDYNGRALGNEEAHYTGINVDDTIKITATGSQTDVGENVNGYEIDWGGANPVNYIFNEDLGTLTVTAAPATVMTGSASKAYDGTPLTNGEASITGLVNGEAAAVTATGSITEAGTAVNTYTIDWGSTNSANYALTEQLGTLTVTNDQTAEITLTAESTSKTYDGTPLTGDSVTAAGLPEGFTYTAKTQGSQTDAGTSPNTVSSYTILDQDGKDVTKTFSDIKTVDGTLTVEPAEASVETGSAQKAYDGKALQNAEASITGLVETDEDAVTVTATGTITKVGTAVNTYTIDWGTANSANYSLAESLGTLEVTKNDTEITFTAVSDAKTYDGTPLSAGSVTVTGLPGELTFKAQAQGSQTNAGTSANTVASYAILNQNEEDVTDNFTNIKTADGTLTVTAAPATVMTGSASKAYDGTPLTNGEASITGLVNGEAAAVTATGSITEAGTAVNTYTIDWGSTNSANYALTEQLGTLTVTNDQTAEITLTAESTSKTYDGTPLTGDSVTAAGLPEGFTYTAKTQGSQTDAGTSPNTVSSYTILDQDGKDVTKTFSDIKTVDGTLTVEPAEASVETGSAQKAYDGKALQNAEASITGLVETDEDAVTVTATGTITKVGTAVNTYTIDWGTANSANYSLAESLGTLEVTKNDTEITFTAVSDAKTYDGTPLSAGSVTVTGLPGELTFKAQAQGSQTNAGTSANTVASYAILNQNEEDVTDNFTNIKTADGTLTVNPADLTIETGSAQKAYDGKPLQSAEVSITGLAETDKDVTVTATGSITKVGTTKNTCTIDWGTVDSASYNLTVSQGTLEVTKNNTAITLTSASASKVYDGTPISATGVTVKGLPDGFTCQASAGGAFSTPPDVGEYKNAFDDMPYTFENEDGEMMAGWRYYVIRNADGEDVTDYFTNVTLVVGTLAITPLKITFDLNCYETVFSGYQWVPDGINGTYENGSEVEQESETMETDAFELPVHLTSIFNLTGGGQLRLDCDGYKDAGSYDITPTETFLSGSAGNYEITYTNNTMVISPMPVTLTLGPASVVYDGNAHGRSLVSASCGEADASIQTLSDTEWVVYGYTDMINETFNVKIGGGGTDPGTYTLNMSFTFANDDPGNYVIEPASASLTIKPLELIIDLGDPEVQYNSHTHGGSISVTYGNGSSAGSSPEGISAKSNVDGSASTEYRLTTDDIFTVTIAGAGPDPGKYTLPCSYKFTPDRSSCYDVRITGNTLTITGVSAEGWTLGRAAAPDEKNPAVQNASDAAGEQKTLVSATPGETDPNGQNASGTTGEADPDGQSAQAMPGETDPDGQSTSDTAGNTDPAGQNTSDTGTSGEAGPDGKDPSDSASAGSNEQIPAAETEKKEIQTETQAPAAETEKKEAPVETQAPAAEVEKKEAPAETQAPAAETEKKEAPAAQADKKEAPAETQTPAAETGKKEKQTEKESETEQA